MPGRLAQQLHDLRRALEQLHAAVAAMQEGLGRRPPPVTVEHLVIEHLEFNLGGIGVQHLSGELNLGLTTRFQLGERQAQQGGGQTGGGVQTGGTGQPGRPATLPGSVVTRQLQAGPTQAPPTRRGPGCSPYGRRAAGRVNQAHEQFGDPAKRIHNTGLIPGGGDAAGTPVGL